MKPRNIVYKILFKRYNWHLFIRYLVVVMILSFYMYINYVALVTHLTCKLNLYMYLEKYAFFIKGKIII